VYVVDQDFAPGRWPHMANTSTLCDQYIIWPMTEACSGNGYCSSEGICICNDGWSGRGEMIDRTGIDCNVNENALTIMHSIGTIMSFATMLMALRANYRALHNAGRTLRSNHSSGGHSSNTNNSGNAAAAVPVVVLPRRNGRSIWTILTTDPASRCGLIVVFFSLSAMCYHLQRAIMGSGSEIMYYWGTALTLYWNPVFFWWGSAVFALILIRHTTQAITHSRGAQGAAEAIALLQPLAMIGAFIGASGGNCFIWDRLATTYGGQEAAMITYYAILTLVTQL
jgi:hypothetical protein